MTDAELESKARSLANELALINNLNIGPRTLDAILAALQKVSAVAHEDGAKGVLLIRCIEHLNVPQQNSNEYLGAECGGCLAATLTAAEAQLAECQKERDEAKRHIYLASGFAMRSGRELEIATALEETPESDRDSADNTIGELLDMIDAGRSVVSRLTAEVERLREDKERLDWLSENVRQNEGLAVGGYWYRSKLRWQETRLRAAIDAAMYPTANQEKQQ